MHEVGCDYISYGAESMSSEMLRNMNKDQTPIQIDRAWDITVESGIRPTMTWILGTPGERIATMIETERFFKRKGFTAWPFLCTPYPGTEYFDKYTDRIVAKYGTVERFVEVLGDATEFSINLTDIPDVMLIGAQWLMHHHRLEGATTDEIIAHGNAIVEQKYGGKLYGTTKS